MVRVFKSTKREDIVARELQKQEIYTEKKGGVYDTTISFNSPAPKQNPQCCDMLPSYRTMKYKSPIWGYFHVQKE